MVDAAKRVGAAVLPAGEPQAESESEPAESAAGSADPGPHANVEVPQPLLDGLDPPVLGTLDPYRQSHRMLEAAGAQAAPELIRFMHRADIAAPLILGSLAADR